MSVFEASIKREDGEDNNSFYIRCTKFTTSTGVSFDSRNGMGVKKAAIALPDEEYNASWCEFAEKVLRFLGKTRPIFQRFVSLELLASKVGCYE